MSEKRANDRSKILKKRKFREFRRQYSTNNAVAIAGPSNATSTISLNESPTPDVFKLNVDCFEQLFEWLSLGELLKFRRTCKRMKQVVDYYITLNYSRLKFLNIRRQLAAENWKKKSFSYLFLMPFGYFAWIKNLYVSFTKITADEADGIAYILNQLDTLKLRNAVIENDFYETILAHCKQLKNLSVETKRDRRDTPSEYFIGIDNEWLLRTYPTLQHFEVRANCLAALEEDSEPDQCTEVLAFLQLNSNIQSFSTNSEFLLNRCRQLLATNVQLDRLNISYENRVDLDLVCSLTNDLYFRGIYKKLHLTIVSGGIRFTYITPDIFGNSQNLESKWKFNNLETLHFRENGLPHDITIPVMDTIKEIRIYDNLMPSMRRLPRPILVSPILQSMATNFSHLRRIQMRCATHQHIEPFIRLAPQLEQIQIWRSFHCNFVELNEERKKLPGARKVTIYIDEQQFLELKWRNSLNFELIQLKRIDPCEFNHSILDYSLQPTY